MKTERIHLRRLTLADSERVAFLANNENIFRNTLSLPFPYTEADAINWISSHEENFAVDRAYDYAIVNTADDLIIGVIGLSNYGHYRGELGYWVGEDYWNMGYATEAAKLILDYAFNHLNYNRVYARHIESNPASGKVMEKIGMTYEGCQREHEYVNDVYENIILYGIIKSDYKK